MGCITSAQRKKGHGSGKDMPSREDKDAKSILRSIKEKDKDVGMLEKSNIHRTNIHWTPLLLGSCACMLITF